MRKRLTNVLIGVLLLANVVVLAALVETRVGSFADIESRLQYGEKLPVPAPEPLTMGDSERIGILALMSNAYIDPRLLYLNAISRRFSTQVHLRGVYPGTEKGTQEFAARHGLHFQLLADPKHNIFRWAGVHPEHAHGGFLIYDRNYQVKFFEFFLPSEDLIRQLVEKYALGKINYASKSFPLFQAGAKLPVMRVRSLVDGREVVLEEADAENQVFVFYPPYCSACSAESSVSGLGKVWEQLFNLDHLPRKQPTVVLLSPQQDGRLVREILRTSSRVFVLESSPAISWDAYDTRLGTEISDPFVVLTDASGYVTRTTTLAELVLAQGGKQQ